MGVCNSPDIFQEKIYKLFEGFDMVCEYINNIIVVTKHDYADHLKALEKFYTNLQNLD